MKTRSLVVMGTSAGGVTALQTILSGLPHGFPLPIAIVHHLPRDSKINFNLVFGNSTHKKVREAESKMPLEESGIYFAPPGYHLLIEKNRTLSLSVEEPVCFSRPSIDVLFSSAAHSLGPEVIGVLLTGANDDGARGLYEIHQKGGSTIVQNPETAESSYMPRSALSLFRPDRILNLDQIPSALAQLSHGELDGQSENLDRR